MSVTEKTKVETAFEQMLNWSPFGCTISGREAMKLLKPLTNAELVTLHDKFGEHYANWARYIEPKLDASEDGEVANDDCSETMMAVEEMHDALRARSNISFVLFAQEAAAKKTRTLELHKKTIPAKKKAA